MKKLLGPVERLFPMPCPLVVGGSANDADTLAVAWINVVSSTPPTIAMGLRNSRHTLELIRRHGDFTVNIPTTAQAAEVDFCGITSGRDGNKVRAAGLTLAPSSVISAPIIVECPYNIECKVTSETQVGEYVVVFGTIVQVHADENIVRPGTNLVEMDLLDPLVYCAGVREYRGLGPKVADAFSAGRELKDSRDA